MLRPTITAVLAPAAAPAPAQTIAVQVRAVERRRRSHPARGLEVAWPGPADDAAAHAIIGYRLSSEGAAGPPVALPRWRLHPGVALCRRAGAGAAALPAPARRQHHIPRWR